MSTIGNDGLINGAIAMIDVLGVKGIWMKEPIEEIITNWDRIVSDFEQIQTAMENHNANFEQHMQFFSDTIIVTYQGDNLLNLLSHLSLHLAYPFCDAMLHRIFFRGVISVGRFRRTRNMIIGPAVDEAAEWYENYNWMGITLCPSASQIIEENDLENQSHGWYERYTVESKNGVNDTWALNWPSQFRGVMRFMADNREPRQVITQILSDHPDESRIRSKYETTMRFFNDMITRRGENPLTPTTRI
ncbi:MAG: hypothetical protein KGI07_05635 [Thaumarchaeota archaeon]|nr:hypothetical protein [Nitrososphaerota archaeon]